VLKIPQTEIILNFILELFLSMWRSEMGKLLLLLSLLSLLFLAVGTLISPNSASFWLATNSLHFQFIRVILASVLFLQFITHPPRHVLFRYLTGVLATVVGLWTIQATYSYQMQLADTLAFLGASLAIGITAIEYAPPKEGWIKYSNHGV
jgi:hypothetical protein